MNYIKKLFIKAAMFFLMLKYLEKTNNLNKKGTLILYLPNLLFLAALILVCLLFIFNTKNP